MTSRPLLALTLALTFAWPSVDPGAASFAQDTQDTDDVLEPIHELFDGMRAGDSTRVRSAFLPEARLVRTATREGIPTYRVSSVDDFARAVGTPHEEVWNEHIWDIRTEVRDNLASVWMKFAFFAGEDFSHCGINSAELVKTETGWKIIQLADTFQKEACEMPPDMDD